MKAAFEAEMAAQQAMQTDGPTASEPSGSAAVPPEVDTTANEIAETQGRWRSSVQRSFTRGQQVAPYWENYTPQSQMAVRPSLQQQRRPAGSQSSTSASAYPPQEPLRCAICDSLNHYSHECLRSYCPRCEKFGHNWFDCYHRPREIDWSKWCDVCQDYGHYRRWSCNELQNQQYRYCIWCREQGHLPTWQCRTNKRQRTM